MLGVKQARTATAAARGEVGMARSVSKVAWRRQAEIGKSIDIISPHVGEDACSKNKQGISQYKAMTLLAILGVSAQAL